MRVWLVRSLWIFYALVFLLLGRMSVADDFNNADAIYITIPDIVLYVLMAIGILLHIIGKNPPRTLRLWKFLCPIFVCIFILEIISDTFSQSSPSIAWFMIDAQVLFFLLPAFYANFRFAYGYGTPSISKT